MNLLIEKAIQELPIQVLQCHYEIVISKVSMFLDDSFHFFAFTSHTQCVILTFIIGIISLLVRNKGAILFT